MDWKIWLEGKKQTLQCSYTWDIVRDLMPQPNYFIYWVWLCEMGADCFTWC